MPQPDLQHTSYAKQQRGQTAALQNWVLKPKTFYDYKKTENLKSRNFGFFTLFRFFHNYKSLI